MQKIIDYNSFKNSDMSKKAVVAIHGWGGNKKSFSSLVKNIKVDDVEWFLPEAPYPIKDESPTDSNNINDDSLPRKSWTYKKDDGSWEIEEPIVMLKAFFNDIIFKKYESSDVYVIGFSQGAAVCYELICSFTHPLGGIFPVGGFMREIYKNTQLKSLDFKPAQFNRPILIGHGKDDDVVPLESSEKAYKLLKKYCKNIDLYIYNGRHKIGIEYLKKVKELILSKYIKV